MKKLINGHGVRRSKILFAMDGRSRPQNPTRSINGFTLADNLQDSKFNNLTNLGPLVQNQGALYLAVLAAMVHRVIKFGRNNGPL